MRAWRFGALCLALFLAGGLLRFQYGWLKLPGASSAGQMPAGLADTVRRFYDDLDRGRYDEAAQLSLENNWGQFGAGVYIGKGLVPRADFVREISGELGPKGNDLTVISLEFLDAAPLPPEQRSTAAYPELATLGYLPAEKPVEAVYRVELAGSLLGPCSRKEWHKNLLVARIGGLGWRVLLPGSSGPGCKRIEQWFQDVNYFAGKQIIQEIKLN